MKKIFLLVLISLIANPPLSFSAQYWWKSSGSVSHSTAANWSPARNTPAATDSLYFDGDSSVVIDSGDASEHCLLIKYFSDYTGKKYMRFPCTTKIFIDSSTTGLFAYPPKLVFHENGATYLNSANNGQQFATACTLYLAQNCSLTVTVNKIFAVKQIVVDTGAVFIGTSAASGINIQSTASPLLRGKLNGTFVNNMNLGLTFAPTGNTKLFTLDTPFTINGSGVGGWHIEPYADALKDTMGFFNYQQSVNWSSIPQSYAFTLYMADSINWINVGTLSNSAVGKNQKFITQNKGLTGVDFRWGSNTATGTYTMVLGNSNIYLSTWDGYTYNGAAGSIDSMGGSNIYISGTQFREGTNHTNYPGTNTLHFVGTGTTGQKFDPENKQYYKINFNHSGTGIDSLSGDTLYVQDTLLHTNGKLKIKTSTIKATKGINILSTDSTLFGGAPVYDSGDASFAAGALLGWATGSYLDMSGVGTQKLTSTGHVIPLIVHKNTGTLQPQDSLNCNNLLDTSTGTWDVDYGTRCTTAVFAAACSVAQSGAMEVVKNLSYGLQVKENVTGTISFVGGVSGTWRDSGTVVADVLENKVGAGVGLTVIKGRVGGDYTNAYGNLWIPGGDSLFIDGDATFNNTGDSVAVTGAGTGYIVVYGNLSTAAGVLWNPNIKVLYRKKSGTIALNGASGPQIQLDSTAATIEDGGTIARLSCGLDDLKAIFEAAKSYTLTAWDSSDFNGDSIVSGTPGTRFKLLLPAADTLHDFYAKDCSTSVVIKCDSTCRTGGNNRNMRFLRNLTISPATGPGAGGMAFTVTGRGLVGGGALFNGVAATSWTVASNLSATGVTPSGQGDGVVKVYSTDCGFAGDTVTITGGFKFLRKRKSGIILNTGTMISF